MMTDYIVVSDRDPGSLVTTWLVTCDITKQFHRRRCTSEFERIPEGPSASSWSSRTHHDRSATNNNIILYRDDNDDAVVWCTRIDQQLTTIHQTRNHARVHSVLHRIIFVARSILFLCDHQLMGCDSLVYRLLEIVLSPALTLFYIW